MAPGVCLISAGNRDEQGFGALIARCGLKVWKPQPPVPANRRLYDSALFLVVDLPRDEGIAALHRFRAEGIRTPALLIVDPGRRVDPQALACGWVMDAIGRDTDPLRFLRWVQSMCLAHTALARARAQAGDAGTQDKAA